MLIPAWWSGSNQKPVPTTKNYKFSSGAGCFFSLSRKQRGKVALRIKRFRMFPLWPKTLPFVSEAVGRVILKGKQASSWIPWLTGLVGGSLGFQHIHNLLSNAQNNKLKHSDFVLLPCSPTRRQPFYQNNVPRRRIYRHRHIQGKGYSNIRGRQSCVFSSFLHSFTSPPPI